MDFLNEGNYQAFLLIFVRMCTFFALCSVFGKRTVPVIARAALALAISFLMTNTLATQTLEFPSILSFAVAALREVAVGFLLSFVVDLFLSVFEVGGQLIDYQMGFAMVRVFDPLTNQNLTISGKLLNTFFMLAFFLTGSHLTLIKIGALSFDILPVTTRLFDFQGGFVVVRLFTTILTLAVQLSLPIMVCEMILEFAVGIMMKAVPQINVFVVNIQVKIFVGFLVFITMLPVFGNFVQSFMTLMFDNMQKALMAFS